MDQKPHARSHGYSTDNANPTRSNLQKPGRFGLLFPELAAVPWTTGDPARDEVILRELGEAMHVAERKDGVIPAGFTYFGQFVDHDMTFDPTSLGENAVDVDDLVNFRTPALDLDSVYGSGPRDQPYLYQRNTTTASAQMLVGRRRACPRPRQEGATRRCRRWTVRSTTCRGWPTACPSARRFWATSATTRTSSWRSCTAPCCTSTTRSACAFPNSRSPMCARW